MKPLAWNTRLTRKTSKYGVIQASSLSFVDLKSLQELPPSKDVYNNQVTFQDDGLRRKNTALVFDWYQKPLEEDNEEDSLYNFSLLVDINFSLLIVQMKLWLSFLYNLH